MADQLDDVDWRTRASLALGPPKYRVAKLVHELPVGSASAKAIRMDWLAAYGNWRDLDVAN